LAKRLGENASRRVKDLMDGRRMVIAIEELYERLVASGAAPLDTSIFAER
jgi:hypothetical protein